MAGTKVLATGRILLLDFHVRIAERHPFHIRAVFHEDDRFLTAVTWFAFTDASRRVQFDVLATVHSHAPIVLQDACNDL